MPKIEFKCPECGECRIIETMVDMVVHSDIVVSECEAGVSYVYGDQTNEDGHVDRYQCADCGFVIVDDTSPHADDGLDAGALAKALKELAEPPKMRPIEMGVCKSDGTWYEVFIEIPDDTPDEAVEAVAQKTALVGLADDMDVARIFVYNTMEDSRPE